MKMNKDESLNKKKELEKYLSDLKRIYYLSKQKSIIINKEESKLYIKYLLFIMYAKLFVFDDYGYPKKFTTIENKIKNEVIMFDKSYKLLINIINEKRDADKLQITIRIIKKIDMSLEKKYISNLNKYDKFRKLMEKNSNN